MIPSEAVVGVGMSLEGEGVSSPITGVPLADGEGLGVGEGPEKREG